MDSASSEFQNSVYEYYDLHGRHDLPWRLPEADGSFSPYKIMVSEFMLQQTQVARVVSKYYEFLELFPTIDALAAAELGDVLRAWSGLGYNRRAKFLHRSAQMVIEELGGVFPRTVAELVALPGVGVNTAGAIAAYAFNAPVEFIETNVRTVYIHHFFQDNTLVSDKQIIEILHTTLDREHPRIWYWALMDYGSFIKSTVGNLNKVSTGYAKQSKFEGSRRQVRGQIIKQLSMGALSREQLAENIPDARLLEVLDELVSEKLINLQADHYSL